jgi:hypothetical protein
MKFEHGVLCEKDAVKKSPFFPQQVLLVENERLIYTDHTINLLSADKQEDFGYLDSLGIFIFCV